MNDSPWDVDFGVAIVGMAGRFPGASSVDQFWWNLCNSVESITDLDDNDICPSIPLAVRQHPEYVRAKGILDDADKFDARFFGINAREAQVTDPQQRLFLEVSWEALEAAGYVPGESKEVIGVFAGMANNTYFPNLVAGRPDLIDRVGEFQTMLANEKDFIATRVSYQLGLTGPSVSLYTGCSTSLVAVCHAFHSLLSEQCDMALAGAATLVLPQRSGYVWKEGGITSRDGRCRPFDRQAGGTVFSEGVAVVVLKRLADAISDGDGIHAVIRGAAINNDGSAKQSFAAPSVEGQAAVIVEAQAQAGFDPASIGYIETHGTATRLGDAVEMEALRLAFGDCPKHACVIGSLKSNVGHLLATAGVAGLIKAARIVKHGIIPPTLHFESAGDETNLDDSPFRVADRLWNWPAQHTRRRAGVSSFGIGGTNAHVVLEGPPPVDSLTHPTRPAELIVLSAKTPRALAAATQNLAAHFEQQTPERFADAAFTLQVGRKAFAYRRAVSATSPAEAAQALRDDADQGDARRVPSRPEIVFLFPASDDTATGMGECLYEDQPVYRQAYDEVARILATLSQADRPRTLRETAVAHTRHVRGPLDMFATEYALAKLLLSWGVIPDRLMGQHLGAFVSGCLASVFSLDAILSFLWRQETLRDQAPSDNKSPADSASVVKGQPILKFAPPRIPIVSAATGKLLSDEEATSPDYWTQAVNCVVPDDSAWRFIWQAPSSIVLEVGPGEAGAIAARRNRSHPGTQLAMSVLGKDPHPIETWKTMWHTVGQLWTNGVTLDWPAMHTREKRRRVALPTYPFERTRHWIDTQGKPDYPTEPESRTAAAPMERVASTPPVLQNATECVAISPQRQQPDWSTVQDRASRRLSHLARIQTEKKESQ